MRILLMIGNLAAAFGLMVLLRDEWSRMNDYVAAVLIFGGGISLVLLNFFYIQATRADAPRWIQKMGEAWKVFRS